MSQANLKTVKKKIKIPNRFDVILLNDDYTSMEFVVDVLRRFFHKEFQAAEAIMLKIHIDGEAVFQGDIMKKNTSLACLSYYSVESGKKILLN